MMLATRTYIPPSRERIREVLGFKVNGPEQAAILDSDGRFIIISGGEQAGKSEIMAQFACERTFEIDHPGIYWLAGRRYEDCEKEFDYLVAKFSALGVLESYSKTAPDKPRRLKLVDGTTFRTLSIAETMTIGREAPDGILGCEAAQISFEGYEKLRARAGAGSGWLLLGGTFESSLGWFPDLWKLWQGDIGEHRSYALPSWTNPHVYPGGRTDPDIIAMEQDLGTEFFLERIAGIARKPLGLVFSRDFNVEWHVRSVEHIPGLPVYLAIDPGYNQAAHALLAIQLPPDSPVSVFDEIYDDHYTTGDMAEEAMTRPWWGDVAGGVIDIQATKNQQAVDEIPIQIWSRVGHLQLDSIYVPIIDGMDRMKSFFRLDPHGKPRLVISPRCKGLLSELGVHKSPLTNKSQAYTWKMDRQGNLTGKTPDDRYNHSIKALTYFLCKRFGFVDVKRPTKARMKRW